MKKNEIEVERIGTECPDCGHEAELIAVTIPIGAYNRIVELAKNFVEYFCMDTVEDRCKKMKAEELLAIMQGDGYE